MFAITISEKGGETRRLDFDKAEITIGRVQGNDVILPKGNVSKRHSRIVRKDGKFIIVDLKSTNGTYVNGRKITSPIVVKPSDKVYIGDFVITLDEAAAAAAEPDAPQPAPTAMPPVPVMPPAPPAPPRRPTGTMPPPPPGRRAAPDPRTMGAPAPVEPPRHEIEAAQAPHDHDEPVAPPEVEEPEPRVPQKEPPPVEEPPPAPEPVRVEPARPGASPSVPPSVDPHRVEPPRVDAPRPPRANSPAPPMAAARPPRATVMGEVPAPRAPAQPAGGAAIAARPSPQRATPPLSVPPAARSAPVPSPALARREVAPLAETTNTSPAPTDPAEAAVDRVKPSAPPPDVAAAPAPTAPPAAPASIAPPSPVDAPHVATGDRQAFAAALKKVVARLAASPAMAANNQRDGKPRNGAFARDELLRTEAAALDAAREVARNGEPSLEAESLARDALAEALGAGPLDALLADPSVTFVSVPRHDHIFVERRGERVLSDKLFSSTAAVVQAAARLAPDTIPSRSTALRIGQTSSGALVTLVTSPVVGSDVVLTIRKPRRESPTLASLSAEGVLSAQMASFLSLAVREKRSVLVTGTGAGRCDLAAALVQAASPEELVVVIEEREHAIPAGLLVARLGTAAGARAALDAALALGADRLVLDEGAAVSAIDALAALPGTIATLPALSAADGIARLQARARLDGRDGGSLREAIASHLHLVVHVARGPGAAARVVQVAELERIDPHGQPTLADVFVHRAEGEGGRFGATGRVPAFAEGASPAMFRN